MHILEKKIVVMFVSLTFLISGLSSISALSNKKLKLGEIEGISTTQLIETVTLYRYGLDGFKSTINIEIEFEQGQDINDAIAQRCEELFKKDIEFQNITNDNTSSGLISFVKSKGIGLHIKFFRNRILFCMYPSDQKASTTIMSLLGENTTTIRGPHMVLSSGFVGFNWWRGSLSFLGLFIRTGFVGLSLITLVKKF